MQPTPLSILQKYFGYDEFRPKQLDIIQSVLAGRDTLGILPTGGGKSLCFQVPTLLRAEQSKQGLCLVVTPLIALMKDQVENLKKRNILAAALYSGMSREQQLVVLDNCIFGDYRFLYVAPERLSSDIFLKKICHIPIILLVVDEAHCISQWGYDFRPAYLTIPNIKKYVTGPILALTATATTRTSEDIQRVLQFSSSNVIKHSFQRKNIFYCVLATDDKQRKLLQVLRRVQGSALVYVRTRETAVEVASFINTTIGGADFYHAGLDFSIRMAKQKAWTDYNEATANANTTRIMVCTNAFGMGIDKKDVRLVVHYDIPDSLEAYYQEAGRVGRDGKKSIAVILFNRRQDEDLIQRRSMHLFPNIEFIESVYNKLCDFLQIGLGSGLGHAFSFSVEQFCTVMRLPFFQTYAALETLSNYKHIHFEKQYEIQPRVKINVTKEDLYSIYFTDLQEELIQYLLRNFPGIFTELQYVKDIDKSNYRGSLPPSFMHHDVFVSLAKRRIITYISSKVAERVAFILERQAQVIIPEQQYDCQKDAFLTRLAKMMEYVRSEEQCRENLILRYFDENTTENCHHCDICQRIDTKSL